jgi:PAS domain S-box-containing protein
VTTLDLNGVSIDGNCTAQQAEILIEMVRRMPVGACVWRLDKLDDPSSLRLLIANAASNKAANEELTSCIGRTMVDIFPTVAELPLLDIYADVVRSGVARNLGEQRFQTDGHETVYTIELFPLPDQTVCVTFENITERKKTEETLRAREADISYLFEQSPVGLALCTMDGTLVQVNPAYARIIGRSTEETLKLSYWQITPESYRPQEDELVTQMQMTGRYGPYEKEYIHRNGHLVPVRLSGLIIERDGKKYIWSSVEDITDSRQAEQVINAQALTLQELSTPLLSISDRLVVMPLVGAIDSQRAQSVMDTLLKGVSDQKATTAIIDITGVAVVDTQVANAIIRAAQAVKLLGAQAVLTGIRPEVAQTLIQLGVDLRDIVTRSTLQSGITFAMGAT